MNDIETMEVTEVGMNNLQIYQQDKAFIDMQISTAKQFPRNLSRCIENAVAIVTMDEEIATKCIYSLKKGGKNIVGASVHLAKILAQQMGNMRVENRVVAYDATHVTCEAVCFDLERNFAIRTQIKKSIVGTNGRYSEDMAVITGNAGNSIALRNAIFAVIDANIINKVYKAAQARIVGDVSDETKLAARRTVVVNGFISTYADYKLTEKEIAASVGKEAVSHITKEDIVTLLGFENALKSGELKLDSVFRPQMTGAIKAKPVAPADKSEDRILQLVEGAKTREALIKLFPNCSSIQAKSAYDAKLLTLK